MAYNQSYTSGDVSKMAVDIGAKAVLEVINLIGLIVLITLAVVIMNQLKKAGLKL